MAISLRSIVLAVSVQLMLLGLLPFRTFAQGLVTRGQLKPHHNHSQRASMSLTKTTGTGAEADSIVLKPADYRNVVIFMHGLGDTAAGWASNMPELGIPNTKFVLPTAPVRPISMAGGYAMNGWSDIYAIAANSREDSIGFDASAKRVQAIIDQEKVSATVPLFVGNVCVMCSVVL
jgi:Phospholipase/Carboxylesterase